MSKKHKEFGPLAVGARIRIEFGDERGAREGVITDIEEFYTSVTVTYCTDAGTTHRKCIMISITGLDMNDFGTTVTVIDPSTEQRALFSEGGAA